MHHFLAFSVGTYPLSKIEVESIVRDVCYAAEKELNQLETDIKTLETRRATLIQDLTTYRQALAPHKMLPDDILTEIFSNCVPQAAVIHHLLGSGDFRLVLCQICSRWRRIAMGSYNLWSCVMIDFDARDVSRALEILPLWLERANGATLYMEVSAQEYDQRVLDLLSRYAHQCHTLVLEQFTVDSAFFELSAIDLSRLEDLQLVAVYRYLSYEGDTPTLPRVSAPVLGDTPSLRSVTFESFGFFWTPELLSLPWHQLTSLIFYCTFPTSAQYYSILQYCENVTRSRLDVFPIGRATQIPLSDFQISMPSLRFLELNTNALANAARFLHSVTLDCLVELEVTISDDYIKTIFAVRTFPALQRLTLGGPVSGSQSDLEAWLRACPAAKDVLVPNYRMEQQIVDQIADGELLPCLQRLVFTDTAPGCLISALEKRQRSQQYSTIVETGITGNMANYELEGNEKMRVARLRMVGVFVACVQYYGKTLPVPGDVSSAAFLVVFYFNRLSG
ncbi:hypothetical protein R3P38DRAFT_1460895 [Favolaschia claudopus]|uniref:F-box domain-containing protein n=1 Tax=Favolaschia claudopus TaxID=2862362 RepID=A0AAW0DQZ0_9AGAR